MSFSLQPLPGIDAVFVLSVKTFHDRIAHVTRELDHHGIAFEFIFDFDRDTIDRATLDRHFEPDALPNAVNSLILKHLHAWRLACERECSRILVFEDDVILHEKFRALLAKPMAAAQALPPGWLVFLGGAGSRVPDEFFLHPGPLAPLPNATAEAYITDRDACQRRMAWCAKNKIRAPADKLLAEIDRNTGISQYWTSDALVEQGSVTGMFDSMLDASRIKHRWIYNFARHRWHRWRRRTLRKLWVRTWHALVANWKRG